MCDRAFCKKALKARSKSRDRGHVRPCLSQKSVKGTVKTIAKRSPPTVPLTKKRQRHGQNHSEAVVSDRAFCKKVAKARSKPERRGRPRPCLMQKNTHSHAPPPRGLRDNAAPRRHPNEHRDRPHPALIANRPFHTVTERFAWILHNLNKKTLLVLT